jgi:nuclear GTP-binding protein
MEFYCIPEFADVHEFLAHVARRIGRLKKGGVPDVEAAAKHVLHDWNG